VEVIEVGMNYVVGYNEKHPFGQQWAEFSCNSTAHRYLHSLIGEAIQDRYRDLYELITQESSLEQMRFDELSQEEFMRVISAIRNLARAEKKQITWHAEGARLWDMFVEPLVQIDERYDPNFKLE
jgi:hypothetical protein